MNAQRSVPIGPSMSISGVVVVGRRVRRAALAVVLGAASCRRSAACRAPSASAAVRRVRPAPSAGRARRIVGSGRIRRIRRVDRVGARRSTRTSRAVAQAGVVTDPGRRSRSLAGHPQPAAAVGARGLDGVRWRRVGDRRPRDRRWPDPARGGRRRRPSTGSRSPSGSVSLATTQVTRARPDRAGVVAGDRRVVRRGDRHGDDGRVAQRRGVAGLVGEAGRCRPRPRRACR